MENINNGRNEYGYESPRLERLDCCSEGVLCSSTKDFNVDGSWGDLK